MKEPREKRFFTSISTNDQINPSNVKKYFDFEGMNDYRRYVLRFIG